MMSDDFQRFLTTPLTSDFYLLIPIFWGHFRHLSLFPLRSDIINARSLTKLTCKFKYLMLSNGRSRLDACSEGGASGFLPRKTMVSDGCASKFPWCKFLFSANVLWYSKTIDLAALRWLSSRGMDKSEIKEALWNFMLIVYFFCQVMFFFAKQGIKRSHRPYVNAGYFLLIKVRKSQNKIVKL